MHIPFSDVPSGALHQQLDQAFHALTEANRLTEHIDIVEHHDELRKLCEVALGITMAAKDLLDNRTEDAGIRVKVGLQSLSEIHLE